MGVKALPLLLGAYMFKRYKAANKQFSRKAKFVEANLVGELQRNGDQIELLANKLEALGVPKTKPEAIKALELHRRLTELGNESNELQRKLHLNIINTAKENNLIPIAKEEEKQLKLFNEYAKEQDKIRHEAAEEVIKYLNQIINS